MVEDETYNSQFTAESVRFLKNVKGHNVAHSMLYGTRQPSSTYDQAQEHYDWEMNNTSAVGGDIEEYPFHRMLLRAIHKVESVVRSMDEDQRDDLYADLKYMTETLVDLWDKNRNPIFANAIAESLTILDATYSARLLLDKVKHEKRDKTALSAILYRLEFGQIGISKDGVKYLERMYDLGEYNNPDYFVNRLTSKGEMGIFNGENKLVRFFYLEDFKDENRDDVIHPAVLEFAYDTLFVPKENETDEERQQRLGFLEEFKTSYFDFYDQKFLDRTGVRFNNLNFKEQGSFLLFSKSVGESVKEKLYDFCQQNGEKGIRLFLLINQKDFLLGQKLLGMSEMFDGEILSIVIDKISSILGQLENVSDFVDGDKRLQKAVHAKLPDIQRKIILKALSVVEDAFATASSEYDDESKANKILKKLSNINTEAVLLGSTLSTMRKMDFESPINLFDNFSETGLYDYEGYEFSSDELAQIRSIYEQNYADAPEMMEMLYAGFLKKIKEQRTEFKVIKQKGKVVAICGFEHLDDGSIYFGKFNIDPSYRGSEIGKEMMENTLDEFARMDLIRADCNVEAPVASNYVERGFVITRAYDDIDNIKSLQIVENTSMNDHFNSKGWSDYYIKKQAVSGEMVKLEGGKFLVYACPVDQVKSAPFSVLESVDDDGFRYVATRYIRERSADANGGDALAYLVFEKVEEKEFEKYTNKFTRPQVVETGHGIFV
jgi:ribosomal protein S18 acetylase RimI-like enzyme